MGAVYLCHNVLSERMKAAVKVLKPESMDHARDRFIREVETLCLLRHEAIVRVVGGGEEPDNHLLYLVMDYIEGLPLDQRLKAGPIPEVEALTLFRALADGLRCAAESDIYHRDIKPSNIMLTGDQRAKLIDFGIAVQAGQERLTKTGLLPGTMAYIPPEAFHGEDPTPALMDVYALGQVLYECLTGQERFGTSTSKSHGARMATLMREKLKQGALDPGPNFSAGTRALVRKATHPEPRKRIADMARFVTGIDAVLAEQDPVSIESTGSHVPASKGPRWGRWALGGLGIAVIAGSLVAVLDGAETEPVPPDGPIGGPPVEVIEPPPPEPEPNEPVPDETDGAAVLDVVPTTDEPPPPKPNAKKPPKKASPVPAVKSRPMGTLTVSGDATTIELIGDSGTVKPGKVPAGSYTIKVKFGNGRSWKAVREVEADKTTTIRCSRAFSRCQ